ncbi:MAG: hypothetical protein ABJO30_11255 [Hyphomicrobiales bacterium]
MTDWLKIREAYEADGEAVTQICIRYGVSSAALYKRAKAENWPQRRMTKKKPKKTSKIKRAANEGGKVPPNKVERRQLIDRLYQAFEKQMSDFEIQNATTADDGINEKDARTLGSLARTLEKLIELKSEEEGDIQTQNQEVDIERLREKLAQRLERMRTKRGTG